MRLILVILSFLLFQVSLAQENVKVFGKVTICGLTKNNISISKQDGAGITKTVSDVTKTKNQKVHINTLIANVIISKDDSVYFDIYTDSIGKFIIRELPKDTFDFRIRINQYMKQEYRMVLTKAKKTRRIAFCLSDSLFIAKTDSIVFSRIPYNADKADQDINNGDIYLLSLFPGDSFLDNGDSEYLEDKFGFKFLYDHFQFPAEYLTKAQNEYNEVVFEYLSKQCNCDFEEEYNDEVVKIIKEKAKANRNK